MHARANGSALLEEELSTLLSRLGWPTGREAAHMLSVHSSACVGSSCMCPASRAGESLDVGVGKPGVGAPPPHREVLSKWILSFSRGAGVCVCV